MVLISSWMKGLLLSRSRAAKMILICSSWAVFLAGVILISSMSLSMSMMLFKLAEEPLREKGCSETFSLLDWRETGLFFLMREWLFCLSYLY